MTGNLPSSLQRPLAAPIVVHVSRPNEVENNRKDLPIVMMEQEIMEAVNDNSAVIICGETGCGKTTQVPQVGLNDAWSMVIDKCWDIKSFCFFWFPGSLISSFSFSFVCLSSFLKLALVPIGVAVEVAELVLLNHVVLRCLPLPSEWHLSLDFIWAKRLDFKLGMTRKLETVAQSSL